MSEIPRPGSPDLADDKPEWNPDNLAGSIEVFYEREENDEHTTVIEDLED